MAGNKSSSPACAAGERLAGALGSLAAEGAESEDALVARLVSQVGVDGGTLADAAVRRGTAAAVRDVRSRHPELDDAMGGGAGGGFTWDPRGATGSRIPKITPR